VVARVSPAALEDLRSEMDDTDWYAVFQRNLKRRVFLLNLQSANLYLPICIVVQTKSDFVSHCL
jgi:hypothetical protein